jgi:hypothetical protein
MSIRNLYFTRVVLQGVGKIFMLKTPMAAPPGSDVRKLLGSYVDEVDGGLLSTKEAPGTEHSYIPEYALDSLRKVPSLKGQNLVLTATYASIRQSYTIETDKSLNLGGSFPGAPATLGVTLDYKSLRRGEIEIVNGQKLYIPRQLIAEGYRHFAAHSDQFAAVMFDNDEMLVDQLLIASHYKLSVESKTVFDAKFDAKVQAASALNAGITYKRQSNFAYEIEVQNMGDFLIGIGAFQADKLAD